MHDAQRRKVGGGGSQADRADGGTVGKRTLAQAYPTGAETAPSPPAGALPAPVRAKMESYFRADFSSVRVREDARAQQLGAVAYAQGDELVFRPGAYDPTSRRGQELIGHELAHVVQQRQGRAAMPEGAGGTGAAPVQRYRDVDMGGRSVHVSDQGSMFVHTNPDAPNKAFYAKLPALQQSQAALAAAGSFIHLEAAEFVHGYARVQPRFVGPGSQQGRIYGHTQDAHQNQLATSGPQMGMAADCNNAARMVMGIAHDPAVTDGAPFANKIERPVMGTGDDAHEVMPGANVAQAASSIERATLTALTDSLLAYRALVGTRPIATSHAAQVLAFQQATANLAAPGPTAWRALGVVRAQHPELYADFCGYAGIDAAAAPEVGDALVAWRFSKDPAEVNHRANGALAQTMQAIVEDNVKRGAMNAALGLRIAALQEQLVEIPNTQPNAAKRLRVTNDLQSLQGVQGQLAGFNGANGAVIATAVLAAVGLGPNTTWNAVNDAVMEGYGADADGERIPLSEALGGGAEAEIGAAVTNNGMWNKHWGGVVMTEGGDYVTLENDASTEPHGAVNTEWRFTMYGTRLPGQSFHEKNEATGDFGSRASTMRFHAPNQQARAQPDANPAELGEELRLEAAERQRALARQQAIDDDLRQKGIPKGLTLRPYNACGSEATRSDRRSDMDPDGGPPALFKMDGAAHGAAHINADPALEAEADAHGAAAAEHVPPASAQPEPAPSREPEAVDAPVAPQEAESVLDAREASAAG